MPDLLFRFVKQKDSLISEMICWETNCPYAHVGLLLPDGSEIGAHANGGVEKRPPNYATWSAQNTYKLAVTDAGYAAAMAYANSIIGDKYDFLNIFGLMFRRDWSHKKEFICSVAAFAISVAALEPLIRVPVSMDRITPRDLWLSLKLIPLQ